MVKRTHQRDVIRSEIVNRLKTFVYDVDGRVYPQRQIAVDEDILPVILVYTNSESTDKQDNVNLKRTLKLSVQIQADGETESKTSEILDLISGKVESVFLDDEQFGGIVEYTNYLGSEEAFSENGKQIIGAIKMDFDLVYYTENVQPDPSDSMSTLSGSVGGLESETQLPQ